MSDLRVVGLRFEVDVGDGKTKIVQMRRAISDTTATVDALNRELGDNVKVSAEKVQTDKEVIAQARLIVSQQERQRKIYNDLVKNIRNEIEVVGRSSGEQLVLNNLRKLGVNATSLQKEEVVKLSSELNKLRQQEQALIAAEKESIRIAQDKIQEQERQRRKTEQVVQQYTRLNQTIKQYGNDAETVNAIVRLGSDATEQQKQEVAQLVQEYQRLRNAGDTAGSGFRNLRGIAQNLGWQLQDVVVQAQMGTNAFVILSQQGSQMAAAFGPWGALIGAGIAIVGAAMPSLITYLSDAGQSTSELEDATKRLNEVFDSGKYSIDGYSEELVELYKTDRQSAELKILQALVDAENLMESSQRQLKEYTQEFLNFTQLTSDNKYGPAILEARFSSLSKQLGLNRNQIISLHNAYQTMIGGGEVSDFVNLVKDMALNTPGASAELKALALQVAEAGIKSDLARKKLEKLKSILAGDTVPTTKNASGAIEDQVKKYRQMTAELTMTDRERARFNFLLNESVGLSAEQVTQTLQEMDAYYDERDAIEARNKAIERAFKQDKERQKFRDGIITTYDKPESTPKDPVIAEMERHNKVIDDLTRARLATKQWEYSENAKLNKLFAKETANHTTLMAEAQFDRFKNQVAIVGQTADFMNSAVNEMFDGGERVREQMEEMSGAQKAMFFLMRSIAAATAFINGIVLGSELAKNVAFLDWTGMSSVAAQTFGTSLGAVNAGAIMGTTFAGAFDNGGYIPSGMTGIVSEYGDELVNGVMVRGPADVTSRVDTAAMMSGGLNVTVENYAPGVTHEVQQIDENTVKIIATKVFNENIDRGVSGVLGKKGTKSNKTLTNNYDVRGRV